MQAVKPALAMEQATSKSQVRTQINDRALTANFGLATSFSGRNGASPLLVAIVSSC